MKVDILAFGAHPDDIEYACGGTILSSVADGKRVAIADLTRGELGTRGCADKRMKEAADAARILGVTERVNLQLEDGFFQHSEENIRKIITVIRTYQPDVILCNAPKCRHPDHARGAQMVVDAAFLSGLRKIDTREGGNKQKPWRPPYIFHYIQHLLIDPSFAIDISTQIDLKIASVLAYSSQFNGHATEQQPETYISDPAFMDTIKNRASFLGKPLGMQYAEGFISPKTLGIKSMQAFLA